ncbi:MAG: hypothetical protein IKV48_00015 [Eggerthellaceae bacterium]|nr:hypothetical protein [Eggerthellaceae bacterium]
MQSLKAGIDHQIAQFGGESARAFKIARNNAAYEQAVRQTWFDNAAAAEYVLAHTNSLYFAKDDTPQKSGESSERFVMGVYLDDAIARSELNARREVLMLALARSGISFDELRIIPSTMGMRERRLFPNAVKRVAELFGGAPKSDEVTQAQWTSHSISEQDIAACSSRVDEPSVSSALSQAMRAYAQDSKQGSSSGVRRSSLGFETLDSEGLAILRRAVCLAVEDIDYAQTLLGGVDHVALELCNGGIDVPVRYYRYWCVLHASHPDALDRMIDPYREAIIARARELGLSIHAIVCRSK